uniref:Pterin-binding domain-containing protein n=1 Tax=Chromera velia CCMP2878 TaxID=1169474 RepID=A0A0G4G6C9_9ALVE|eukprot:Cvel_4214.t1-p1 / transcript=Cvel_4214.t1 / gene=Cvel_4214 / organism=Chromera_velia_CCMP2878 / gene_product=Folic acid synthesis protein fol1, putative / transcript_product=Folic acid synthesis protein fol1, putative / location=Cvel_scaffold182:26657-31157(-) / protein_length=558 / sequence_SO=supercontig / SO=protein_coding / is_pseudo=false
MRTLNGLGGLSMQSRASCRFHSVQRLHLSHLRRFSSVPSKRSDVIIGIGSNAGGVLRLQNIEKALKKIGELVGPVVGTSCLYATSPHHSFDTSSPPSFLNACIRIQTPLSPHESLKALKSIENMFGRNSVGTPGVASRSRVYSSRPLDLDILFFDRLTLESPDLSIPHPRLHTRPFVLEPLADLCPDWEHPTLKRTVAAILLRLELSKGKERGDGDGVVKRVFPLGSRLLWSLENRRSFDLEDDTWDLEGVKGGRLGPLPTRIMGILNVTPDSFSDGGKYFSVEKAVEQALAMHEEGADMIDIGGESTRPGAVQPLEEEEMRRVIPVIQKIREVSPNLPISIDTRRASVAEAAVGAGADLVNDVTGGVHDSGMAGAVSRSRASFCVMHMRGDPGTMDSLCEYEGEGGVVGEVGGALFRRLADLSGDGGGDREAGGVIPLWRMCADVGLGFAKTPQQSLSLLRELPQIRARLPRGVPLLVGYSRKRLIAHVINQSRSKRMSSNDASIPPAVPMEERDVTGAAAAFWCAQHHAEIVRVHDVKTTRLGRALADGMFREAEK